MTSVLCCFVVYWCSQFHAEEYVWPFRHPCCGAGGPLQVDPGRAGENDDVEQRAVFSLVVHELWTCRLGIMLLSIEE